MYHYTMSTLTKSKFEKIVFNVEDCDLNNLVENFVAKAYLSSDIKKHMKKSFPIIWVGTINFYVLHAYYSFFNARYKAMTQSKTR